MISIGPQELAEIERIHGEAYLSLLKYIDGARGAIEEFGSHAVAAGAVARVVHETWDGDDMAVALGCALVELARREDTA